MKRRYYELNYTGELDPSVNVYFGQIEFKKRSNLKKNNALQRVYSRTTWTLTKYLTIVTPWA